MNAVQLIGRITAVPELRYTPQVTAVADGNLAVDDGFGDNKKSFFSTSHFGARRLKTLCNTSSKASNSQSSGDCHKRNTRRKDRTSRFVKPGSSAKKWDSSPSLKDRNRASLASNSNNGKRRHKARPPRPPMTSRETTTFRSNLNRPGHEN